jgi:hypothetical protein
MGKPVSREGIAHEWKVTMRITKRRTKNISSTVVKIVMALAFTSVIGGASTAPAPAFADDNGRHLGQRHWQQEHDRYYERERHEYQPEYRPGYRREYRPEYRPYVSPPPPVVYAPYPSPGIGLFFDFR